MQRLLIAAIVACSACARSEPSVATAASEPEPAPAPPPAPDATPPRPEKPRVPAGASLYQGGKPYAPRRDGDDRFTCWGKDETVDACRKLHPNARCVMEAPVGYWESPIRCGGARITELEMDEDRRRVMGLPIPPCQCSCDPSFMTAQEQRNRRVDECANAP